MTPTPPPSRSQLWLARILTTAGLVLILALTLGSHPPSIKHPPPSPWCLRCAEGDAIDVVLNILLFIPLGAGLTLLGVRRRVTLPTATVLSATIELLQYSVITGRDASIRDVLCNTTGAAVGIFLALRWRRWLLPAGDQARRALLAALLFWGGVLGLSSWGLRPILPGTEWWVQLDPRGLADIDFPGQLLSASLDGKPLENGEVANLESMRDAMRRPPVIFELKLAAGGPIDGTSPIFGLVTADDVEIIRVAQQGGDLLVGYNMNSTTALLGVPVFRLRSAFESAAGDTLTWRAEYDGGHFEMSARHSSGRTDNFVVAITPGLGWAVLWPFDAPGPAQSRLLTVLWAFFLPVPAGYFASLAVQSGAGRGRTLLPLAAVAVAGGVLAPLLAGLAPMSAAEGLATLLGATGGWLAANVATRLAGTA
jgi:hypothetical protein